MNFEKIWTTRILIGERTLPFSLKELVFLFLVPVTALLLASFILRIFTRRILKSSVSEESRRAVFEKWFRRIARIIILAGAVLSFFSLMGIQAWAGVVHFFGILNKPFFTSGKTSISVVSLLLIIPVIIAAKWLGALVSRSVSAGILKRFNLGAERAFSLGRLIRYAVIVLVVFTGFTLVGIDLSIIGVILGVLGIGIGFGIQFLVADFFAGITLITMGLVKEGDRIRIAGTYDGIIRHIRLLNTELVTFENETLIIPNSQLTGGAIHNFSYKDPRVVIKNEVDVSYNSDLDEVISIMKDVGARNPWHDTSTEVDVRVKNFADSGITMQLRTMIRNAADGARAFSWINLEIWRAFRDNNVEIPFPQRVLHTAPEQNAEMDSGSDGAVPLIGTENV